MEQGVSMSCVGATILELKSLLVRFDLLENLYSNKLSCMSWEHCWSVHSREYNYIFPWVCWAY